MFYTLIAMAVLAFFAHVALLIASFPAGRISRSRYLLSHATLWLTGPLVFLLTVLYAGAGRCEFIDYFDTFGKKMLILVATQTRNNTRLHQSVYRSIAGTQPVALVNRRSHQNDHNDKYYRDNQQNIQFAAFDRHTPVGPAPSEFRGAPQIKENDPDKD